MQGSHGAVYLACCGNWECRCGGDVFQKGESKIYGCLDVDDYRGGSNWYVYAFGALCGPY